MNTVDASASTTVTVTADVWRLQLQVAVSHSDQQEAFRRRDLAIRATNTVLRVCDVAATDEKLDDSMYNEGMIRAGWSVAVTGSGENHAALQNIIARLAGVSDVMVHGPEWSVSSHGQRVSRLDALDKAAKIAREDAQAMAQSLGVRLGKLAHLSSVDASQFRPMMARAARMSHESVDVPERTLELDVEARQIEVSAQVQVQFLVLDS